MRLPAFGTATLRLEDGAPEPTASPFRYAGGALETSRGTQTSSAAVAQLSEAIDHVAHGATEQARQVQQAASTAARMATGVQQMARAVDDVAAASRETVRMVPSAGFITAL